MPSMSAPKNNMQPQAKKSNLFDILSEASDFAVKSIHRNERNKNLKSLGIEQSHINIWDQLNDAQRSDVLKNRQSQDYNDYLKSQNVNPQAIPVWNKLSSHERQAEYDQARSANNPQVKEDAFKEDRELAKKLYKDTLLEAQKYKNARSSVDEIKKLLGKAYPKKGIAKDGSTTSASPYLDSWFGKSKNVAELDRLGYTLAEAIYGENPTDTQMKSIRNFIPTSSDSKDIQLSKINALDTLIADKESRGRRAQELVRGNQGIVPNDFSELLEQQGIRQGTPGNQGIEQILNPSGNTNMLDQQAASQDSQNNQMLEQQASPVGFENSPMLGQQETSQQESQDVLQVPGETQELEPFEVGEGESYFDWALRNLTSGVIAGGADLVSSIPFIPFEILESTKERSRQYMINRTKDLIDKPGKYTDVKADKDAREYLKSLESKSYKESPNIFSDTHEKLREVGRKAFYKDYLTPRTDGEKQFQDVASLVPMYIASTLASGNPFTLTGLTGFLGRSAVGNAVGNVIEKSYKDGDSNGKFHANAARLVIPPLLNILNPFNIYKGLQVQKAEAYNKSIPELTKGQVVSSKPFKEGLNLADRRAHGVSGTSTYTNNFNAWEKDLVDQKGNFKLDKLLDFQKEINELSRLSERERYVYEPIKNSLKDLTTSASPKIKEAFDFANTAHALDQGVDTMGEFVDKTFNGRIPLTVHGLKTKALAASLNNPGSQSFSVIGKLAKKYPDRVIKYLMNAGYAAAYEQTGPFIKSINNLGKLIDKVEEDKK